MYIQGLQKVSTGIDGRMTALPTETIQEMPYEYPTAMCIDCFLKAEKT